ncbi:GHKL domain-containing protein, partial [Sphingomonas koreensis]|uniref:sensor histidine kinase n=1 Tax=Sphingomonas koreensis TaxID=93064 RepID=UPI000F7F6A60
QFIRHELERGKVTWSVDIPDLQKHIQVDPIQIQQVLVNLLLNAVQILKDSQTRRPSIQVAGHHHSDCYVLEIRDNGPGLPAESLSRIFDSFYTSRPEGLGLGLSICKTIVEAHGGTIVGLNRTDHSGAIFRVTLPVLPSAHHRSEDVTA